jgi:hypothetical protein
MTTKRWIAEGATVLEEGGEYDDIICYTSRLDEAYGGIDYVHDTFEAAHHMAQTIAHEHNALLEIQRIITTSVYQGNDAYDILDDIRREALGVKA